MKKRQYLYAAIAASGLVTVSVMDEIVRKPLPKSLTIELIDQTYWSLEVAEKWGNLTERQKEIVRCIMENVKQLSREL